MKQRLFVFSLFLIYMALLTIIMMWQGIVIVPTRYLFVLILGSLLVKRARNFIFDWLPFLFVLISYDFLRGLVGILIPQIHYREMINLDLLLSNPIPAVILQQTFFHPNNLSWYDFAATFLYFLHFILPVGFGFLLWIYKKSYFREFVTGFTILSYAILITYIIFPAAPPWMATNHGYITGVSKIMDETLVALLGRLDFTTAYHNLNPNPIASVPSMHAAYPFLILLFSLHFFGKKALFFLPYVLAIWFAIIYLGEHYVTDIILGVMYATFFFVIAEQVLHKINWQQLINKYGPKNN